MPQLVAPNGNPVVSSGLGGAWLPGPIELPEYEDVMIGKLLLPWGPRRIDARHAPQVVSQLTWNAIFRYDMGFIPNVYIIEGYPNGGDPEAMKAIIDQFGTDPIASVQFLVPIMSIVDMVSFTLWNPLMDANASWKEPFYHLELVTSSGGYTDLVAGVAPLTQ